MPPIPVPTPSQEWYYTHHSTSTSTTTTSTTTTYKISTSRTLLSSAFINAAFSTQDMFWATPLPAEQLEVMLDHSLTLGVYVVHDQGSRAVSYTHLTLPTKRIV